VTTPDRLAYLAACEAQAAAAVAGPAPAEDARTHELEIMASHEGRPTVAQQNVCNGAGIPAEDRGMQ
jgi:hypothetical protein